MKHFHPLAVKEIKKETADCVSVTFQIPEDLKNTFSFTQGQNLTMRITLDAEEYRRSYSICSSPFDNELRVAIKKVSSGKFSTWANEVLKTGDLIDVMAPTGKFNAALHPSNKKNYLAFAAGSGITPVFSIIKTTLMTEPQSEFTLVYGNRNKNTIVFKEQLEALKDKFINRFRIIHILSRERAESPINAGRIDKEKLSELSKIISYKTIDDFFICGPEEMLFCAKDFLEQNGIEKKKIHFELFTTPGQIKSIKPEPKTIINTGPKSSITVKLDGRSFEFDLGFNSENILDAALQQGADLPYACKGGVCCTCKAKLLEGEVDMDVHWGLEEEEIEQGFILTCQSHPKTDKVVIDFDIK
ncbi:MAG: 1,2-phenylacetyl-CoA epoxidase subunit PaaE [Ferruginibacter sp.]